MLAVKAGGHKGLAAGTPVGTQEVAINCEPLLITIGKRGTVQRDQIHQNRLNPVALHHLAKILGLMLDRRHITVDSVNFGGDTLEDLISDPHARAALDQLARVQEAKAKAAREAQAGDGNGSSRAPQPAGA